MNNEKNVIGRGGLSGTPTGIHNVQKNLQEKFFFQENMYSFLTGLANEVYCLLDGI